MNSTQEWQSVTWFEVDEHQSGQRIDNFLFSRLKGVPKSRIYRLMREGQVRVNKKRIKAETKLNIGDQIRVAPIRYEPKDETPAPVSDKVAQSLLSRVIYEDEGLMVVNKPSGIAVHGGSGVAYGLIEGLRAATGKKYLELIHRIDRDTSGLVMISKKRSTLKTLQDLLREHKIKKTYAAIVKGNVVIDRQLIDAPLHRYELANGERRVCVSKEGKESKTQWNVAERFMHATLVYASPLSGRTHQIRVHGLSIGHPLIGDEKYGHETAYKGPKARRLCLHALRLEIPGYETIEAPLPEDMQSLVAQLRAQKKDKEPVLTDRDQD
ncbi:MULTISPECIES: RluA family pseudouridine synthase [Acinetobacter]|jgi:23S rRNA pseudouridine955/2504/2580 synthase|uniref:RluA family pseudouridine synthase n=1 Tax=Acinetobacter TaxID=469 RepID=UPI00103A4A0A|nr:RluA family pseudouridine synthase [Acinetobacter sp. ANC 3781]TCB77388.1 RluA family pseudouridine synthase [Acinetobacter sp. ANC 3781]